MELVHDHARGAQCLSLSLCPLSSLFLSQPIALFSLSFSHPPSALIVG